MLYSVIMLMNYQREGGGELKVKRSYGAATTQSAPRARHRNPPPLPSSKRERERHKKEPPPPVPRSSQRMRQKSVIHRASGWDRHFPGNGTRRWSRFSSSPSTTPGPSTCSFPATQWDCSSSINATLHAKQERGKGEGEGKRDSACSLPAHTPSWWLSARPAAGTTSSTACESASFCSSGSLPLTLAPNFPETKKDTLLLSIHRSKSVPNSTQDRTDCAL